MSDTPEKPKPDAREFINGQPYTNIAGELVANCIVLIEEVKQRRPEVGGIAGSLHVTLDAEHGVILVGLSQLDGKVILIERIVANVYEPATFGKSELPLAVKEQRYPSCGWLMRLQVDPDDQAPRIDTKNLSVVRFYLCANRACEHAERAA